MKAIVDVGEAAIEEFVKSIKKGPFACLNPDSDLFGKFDGADSAKVVEHGNGKTLAKSIAVNEPDIIDCAVYQAYLDMCRTARGVKESAKVERELIGKSLREYFEISDAKDSCVHERKMANWRENEEEFDKWYKCVIELVKNKSNRLTVGQIQKLINMSFKYLYCCEDIRGKESFIGFFENCHMALDAYTLAWFQRVDEDCYKRIPKDGNGSRSWSKITDGDTYFEIVEATRKHCTEGKWPYRRRPFYAEFLIWPNESSIAALHAVIKEAEGVVVPDELKKFAGDVKALKKSLGRLGELESEMSELYKR